MDNIQRNTQQEIESLEAQVCNLESEVTKKRAALRVAQKACNRLEYDHGEIEKLVRVVMFVAVNPPKTRYPDVVKDAMETSLCKMYAASNFYTPRSEEGEETQP